MSPLEKISSHFKDIRFLKYSEDKSAYSHDASENLYFEPDVVAIPNNTEEVQQLVQYCNQYSIPIFPRGAGTGLTGGSLANQSGLMLSLEKLNSIIAVDKENFLITVESGVINYHIQEELKKYNLFYPPDPSSWQSCFIGGNIATNAGGPRAVKYGVTANWVLNLEVVLPNGELIWTGANTLKNATTYNLTQLYVGSEGTLGIITKAVLKVAPKPKFEYTMRVPFYDLMESAEAISFILQNGKDPSTLEFMDRNALIQLQKHQVESVAHLEENSQAQLYISFDGNQKQEVIQELEETYELLSKYQIGEVLLATDEEEKNRLWLGRRKLAKIVKANGFTIEEDTVVPPSRLPELVQFAHELEDKYPIELVCYGHAGDGNLHIRIKHAKYLYSYENKEVEEILVELFRKVKELGGTVSAEHGIGLVQRKYVPIFLSKTNLEIQKNIKKAIDPKGIMNPGKVFL